MRHLQLAAGQRRPGTANPLLGYPKEPKCFLISKTLCQNLKKFQGGWVGSFCTQTCDLNLD